MRFNIDYGQFLVRQQYRIELANFWPLSLKCFTDNGFTSKHLCLLKNSI